MAGKVKIATRKNDFPSMQKSIEDLNGIKVNVGVLEGEHAWLASIHEYGCRIKVTPKMRAYLHRKGLHLKKSTTEIIIPERSFLRAGFDENNDRILKATEAVLPDVLLGTMSVEKYAKLVGLQLATAIKQYAVKLRTPPNHPFTVKEKKSSNPLVDTGDMINSIMYEVDGGSVSIPPTKVPPAVNGK